MTSSEESPLKGLRILTSPLEREIYSKDQAEIPPELGRVFLRGLPEQVVQPRSEEEVLAVLQYAAERNLPVVPRGAASSAYGGAVPARGGIVVDLSLMRTILALDAETETVAVEAGVRWADLDEFLAANDFAVRSHPSSWFSTVAGWLSTGGCGMYSLGFGPFADSVEWIRVADFTGVWTLRRDEPDFAQFVHTEGQMGIVVQLGLRVRPRPATQIPLLFTARSPEVLLTLGTRLADRFQPVHMTFYDSERLHEFNALQRRAVLPEAYSLLVVVEDEGQAEAVASYAAEAAKRAEHYQASYLWEHRLFPMQVKQLGPGLLGTELLLKTTQVSAYLRVAGRKARAFRVTLSHEAHFTAPDQVLVISAFLTDQRRLDRYLPGLVLVLRLTRAGIRRGGRAYGIGLWNRPFLKSRFSAEQLAGFRRYKRRIDPRGLLNPGKGFDPSPELLSPLLPFLPLARPVFLQGLGRLVETAERLLETVKRPAQTLLGQEPPPAAVTVSPEDLRSAAECAHCSACITVCPAYLADRTELVTARGKLMALERLGAGEDLAIDDARKLFDCIHCSACTNVCQSGIDLVPIWDRLEAEVARRYGKPRAQIEDFAHRVEAEPEYHDLVRKGLAYPLQALRGGYKRV